MSHFGPETSLGSVLVLLPQNCLRPASLIPHQRTKLIKSLQLSLSPRINRGRRKKRRRGANWRGCMPDRVTIMRQLISWADVRFLLPFFCSISIELKRGGKFCSIWRASFACRKMIVYDVNRNMSCADHYKWGLQWKSSLQMSWNGFFSLGRNANFYTCNPAPMRRPPCVPYKCCFDEIACLFLFLLLPLSASAAMKLQRKHETAAFIREEWNNKTE